MNSNLRNIIWNGSAWVTKPPVTTPTIEEQIAVIQKVKEYKIFEDDQPALRAVLDTLYATRFFEKAKDPMRVVR